MTCGEITSQQLLCHLFMKNADIVLLIISNMPVSAQWNSPAGSGTVTKNQYLQPENTANVQSGEKNPIWYSFHRFTSDSYELISFFVTHPTHFACPVVAPPPVQHQLINKMNGFWWHCGVVLFVQGHFLLNKRKLHVFMQTRLHLTEISYCVNTDILMFSWERL